MKPLGVNKTKVINNSPKTAKLLINQAQKTNITATTLHLPNKRKQNLLLITLYLSIFITTGGISSAILLNNKINFNNHVFNPDTNNSLWLNYYRKHEQSQQLIDLNNISDYFKDHKITYQLYDNNLNTIKFSDILNAIDNDLQTNKFESTMAISNPNLLPNNFLQNVRYNPAVDFTIDNDKTQVDNYDFAIPKKYHDCLTYNLNFTTSSEAKAFGIANENSDIKITVVLQNEIAVNIANLPISFEQQNFPFANPKTATIDDIKTHFADKIKTKFVAALVAKGIKTTDINDTDYDITFDKLPESHDFNDGVAVTFNINTFQTANHYFSGTFRNTINVRNQIVDLSQERRLQAEIETAYYNQTDGKQELTVQVNNIIGESGDDTKINQTQKNNVNQQISNTIKKLCQKYFNENYPNFQIEEKDYEITTSLAEGADLFNHKSGLGLKIQINPSKDAYKFTKNGVLNAIDITVHGHNANDIAKEAQQSPGFKINGIWLSDGQDSDKLQDDIHYYCQDNLLEKWTTGDNSIFQTMKKTAYSNPNSFTGNLQLDYNLEGKELGRKQVDIATIANFWNVLSETKVIFLETKVTNNEKGRTLDEVKMLFFKTKAISDDPEDLIYTLDLSDNFKCAISGDAATLTFPNFNYDIKYQQKS